MRKPATFELPVHSAQSIFQLHFARSILQMHLRFHEETPQYASLMIPSAVHSKIPLKLPDSSLPGDLSLHCEHCFYVRDGQEISIE
jgi:hypothetical protein